MSLGWSNDSNIYSNFQQGVQKQLDARKKLVANLIKDKKGNFSFNLNKLRSDSELVYLNSNTGWVKLSSGVDQKKEDEEGKEYTTNQAARENVLFGGSFSDYSKKVRGGLDTQGTSKNSSYNFEPQYGFRAMAGITAANIKTQGTFGAIKRATIEFTVNSLADLEKFESLYMLPGYSVLLEWGHSMILNNKGQLDTVIKTYTNWFENVPQNDPDNEEHRSAVILEEVETLRRNQDFNYDVLFGRISNYTWSFNPEGTYNCQIQITGYGELAESLSALFSPNKSGKDKKIESKKFSKFGTYLDAILNFVPTGTTMVSNFILEKNKDFGYENAESYAALEGIISNYAIVNIKNGQNIDGSNTGSASKFIALGKLFDLINESFMLKEDNVKWVKFYAGKHDSDQRMPIEGENRIGFESLGITYEALNKELGIDPYKNITPFITFDDHISSNLNVCFLPKDKSDSRIIKMNFAEDDAIMSRSSDIVKGDTNDILNIMVNVQYVYSLFEEYIKKNKNEDITIYQLVKDLLSAISKSLGNINSFSLEARDQVYYVNDRQVVPPAKDITYTLDLYGLKGLTSNVSLQSTIPSSLSTLIAIGASAAGATLNENIFNFQSFYRDFKDRIIPFRGTESDPENSSENDRAREAASVVGDYINAINIRRNIATISRHDLIPAHQVLTNLLLKKALIEFKANPPGIIPIQLTFEIHGISGLRITDVFNLGPGLLPSRYKDNISFTITGIDNQISNNRWTTTVSAVMMSTVPMDKIAENEVSLNEAAFDKIKEAIFDELRDPSFKNAEEVRKVIESGIYGDLFKEKGNELTSANLDITRATARFAINLMARISALIKQDNSSVVKTLRFRWTAGNDSTHFNLPYESPHQFGNGLDLAIQQDFSIEQRDKAIEIVSKAAAFFPQVYFRDEYTNPSAHSKGPHFHFGIDEAKFKLPKQKVIEQKTKDYGAKTSYSTGNLSRFGE